jgi:hypothetical protein
MRLWIIKHPELLIRSLFSNILNHNVNDKTMNGFKTFSEFSPCIYTLTVHNKSLIQDTGWNPFGYGKTNGDSNWYPKVCIDTVTSEALSGTDEYLLQFILDY